MVTYVRFNGCKFGCLLINLWHFPSLFLCALPDSEEEEEIFVRKKAKNQKVLQDSESEEEEDGGSSVQEDALAGDKENEEEKENFAAERKKKSHRVRPALLDSDDSNTGDRLQIENLETGRMSALPERELEEKRPQKSGKKHRKHKHNVEEEPAKEAVGKSRRRKEKEKIMESIKQLRKEKKPVAEVSILAENLR